MLRGCRFASYEHLYVSSGSVFFVVVPVSNYYTCAWRKGLSLSPVCIILLNNFTNLNLELCNSTCM